MREHPVNRGKLCPKGAAILDYVYSPDRLQHPMKRKNGEFTRITWDEALDTIASKLEETKERYGAKGLATCLGMSLLGQGAASYSFIRRFTDVYGTPNFFSVESMCYRTRLMGYILTTGSRAVADTENSRCILLWGHNPNASTPPDAWNIIEAKRKGARLIVIDPRRTPLAKKADIHLQPRPGSDCALALGILNVIITEKLYDEEFVATWTTGFNRLAEHVKQYPPEEMEKLTWIPAAEIKRVAQLYATTKPACILQGINALDQTATGVQNARAIAILQSITGNLDVPGGFIIPPRARLHNIRLLEMIEGKPLGINQYPLFYEVYGTLFGEGQAMTLPETLLTDKPYPIKTMIVSGSNPLRSWPNSKKVKEAFGKLDFLVVMDLFMTETTQLAHIVLPAASFLERNDICSDFYNGFGLPYLMLRQKIIDVGECWSDMTFWLELAQRMGYKEYFPWNNEEEILDYLLEPSGLTLQRLHDDEPGGVFYRSVKYRQYEHRDFRTPSRKVELYSKTLEELGQDPLPTHRESQESPVSAPALAREYPLILTTGARIDRYLHSQLHNIPRLQKGAPKPTAEIHPSTAAEYCIEDKETINVETKRGSIEIEARLSNDILRGVVSIPHGWEKANVNLLTDMGFDDPLTGVPAFKSMLCKINKTAS